MAESPTTTASQTPSRRASTCWVSAIGLQHRSHLVTEGAALLIGNVRQGVLPQRQHHPGGLDHAERARQEPDVEVRATVAPTIEVDASEVADGQQGTLDPCDDDPEGR